jgi:LytS/YehU family sensor histidine kinase
MIAILFNFFATTSISFFSSMYFVGERKKALEVQHNTLKIEHLENKMEMLNNQLSAHFLFNSLNDIYASAVLQNGETPEMILKLSNIMRFITYDANLNEISFNTEIQQAKNYISFFEIKSDNKLNINFKEDNTHLTFMTMPMLLIPLIENALKHGNLNDTEKKPVLNIDVSYNGNILKITVGNSYQLTPSNELPKGIGFSNYKRRLELRYPGNHVLHFNHSDTYFETTLTLSI